MARLLHITILALILALTSSTAVAGLFVCNNTAKTVSVAVGWKQAEGWVSRGWTTVRSQECKSLLIGRLTNRYYYYYAKSDDGLAKWSSDSGGYFCTTDDRFFLKSDTDSCAGETFSKLDVGDADQYTFNLTEQKDPTLAAIKCASARSAGIDAFSKCWMEKVATSKQKQILDCVDRTKSKASLAICAAGASGEVDAQTLKVATCANNYISSKRGDQFLKCVSDGNLSDDEAKAFNCAVKHKELGDAATCLATESLSSDQQRVIACVASNRNNYVNAGLCAAAGTLTPEQEKVATCANNYISSKRGDQFLKCVSDGKLSDAEAKAFNCAVNHKELGDAATCLATESLSSDQQRVIACVASNRNNYVNAGLCAAAGTLTPEQEKVAKCVMKNRSSYLQMGLCASGSDLSPEQQVFASCAIQTGAQPYAFAGCVGTQLTMNELQKCITDGIGGGGCFGDNNTAVKFVRNAWKDVTEGPGPSNDLLGQDGWVGRKMQDVAKDVSEGAGNTNDVVGADGWLCTTLFGGCD